MNPASSETPLSEPAAERPSLVSARSSWEWLKRLLACNPFYLLSAALLLFGIYRVSVDPGFLSEEAQQLAFNFTALQFYECLLVITALVLARSVIWYDATLLASLEAALLVVPFLLVSQAALINPAWVWGFCAGGLALACLRAATLRRGFRVLNLPGRLLGAGAVVLAANAVLPVVYRVLHENKVGTRPDFGAAFATNEWVWLGLLPALVALAACLPVPRAPNALVPGRRWLPEFFLGLVLVATGVHLWSLGYVYDFYVRRELVAPALWVLAWVVNLRLPAYAADAASPWRIGACVLPALSTLLPIEAHGNTVAAWLCAANAVAYAAWALSGAGGRLCGALALVSAVFCAVNWPGDPGFGLVPELADGRRFLGALGVLAVAAALASRHPAAGFAGATALFLLGGLLPDDALRGHWRVQAFVICVLLHSLRWDDDLHRGFGTLRVGFVGVWMLASGVFYRCTEVGWGLSLVGASVGVFLAAVWWWRREAPPGPLWAGACLVTAIAPVVKAWALAGMAPGGVLAMLASLLLFALGTVLAYSRHLWQTPLSVASVAIERDVAGAPPADGAR